MISAFYKKDVSFNFAKRDLNFKVSQELFSSTTVDLGTRRLLRSFVFHPVNYSKILDVGCGYGPIGLALKASQPTSVVHFIDKDALALEFTEFNLYENKLSDETAVFASLGYQQVIDSDYDLIVSNIPAKVGSKVLSYLLLGAKKHLKERGQVVIVVIDAITEEVKKMLSVDGVEITYQRSWPGHTVFHYCFTTDSAENPCLNDIDRPDWTSIFYRGSFSLSYKNHHLELLTTYNLPEFDELNHTTSLLLSKLDWLEDNKNKIAVINPQQGHIPVALASDLRLTQLLLLARDLQALQTSHFNLQKLSLSDNSIELLHQISWQLPVLVDSLVGVIPEKQPTAVYKLWWQQADQQIKTGGVVLLAASSTTITRINDHVRTPNWRLKNRFKEHGYSVGIWIKISF